MIEANAVGNVPNLFPTNTDTSFVSADFLMNSLGNALGRRVADAVRDMVTSRPDIPQAVADRAVSYTHLTLPTIYSV